MVLLRYNNFTEPLICIWSVIPGNTLCVHNNYYVFELKQKRKGRILYSWTVQNSIYCSS